MNGVSANDIEFCWKQVLRYDPWFKLHHSFASGPLATRILALHALFEMFERALTMSEESLGVTQLAWWRAELQPERSSASAHPVVRALTNSGALERMPQELLDSLVAQSLERLRAQPVNDKEGLKALCEQVGKPRVQLELALCSDGAEPELLRGRCSGTGLGSLVSLAVRDQSSTFWFVPLELQARHGCDIDAIGKSEGGATALVHTLRNWGIAWFDNQVKALSHVDHSTAEIPKGPRWLMASTLSHRLRFVRTAEALARGGRGEPGRWRLSDFIRVWAACRRLSA